MNFLVAPSFQRSKHQNLLLTCSIINPTNAIQIIKEIKVSRVHFPIGTITDFVTSTRHPFMHMVWACNSNANLTKRRMFKFLSKFSTWNRVLHFYRPLVFHTCHETFSVFPHSPPQLIFNSFEKLASWTEKRNNDKLLQKVVSTWSNISLSSIAIYQENNIHNTKRTSFKSRKKIMCKVKIKSVKK